MNRRQFLQSAPLAKAALPQSRPNILLFFPDQWRHDWHSVSGLLDVRTPHLQEVVDRGVRFTNAIVPSPLCAPSRACLATGREYPRCGVPGNRFDLPLNLPTFYQRLRESGYHVIGCGKLDMHKKTMQWGLDGKRLLAEWGFSDGIDNAGKRDAIGSGAETPQDPYMAMLHQRGLSAAHVADFKRRRNYADTFPTPLPADSYCDNWIGANGLRLLEAAPKAKPWYLAVNFAGPHEPMDITSEMEKTVRDRKYPLPSDNGKFDAATHQRIRQNYAAMIENLDRWLGIYLQVLKDRREIDRTLVVVSSDHGEMLGDHGLWQKSVPWQPSIGVPLAVMGPGVRRGKTVNAPVTTLDLGATFLDIAGVRNLPNSDSQSLKPLLTGNARQTRSTVQSALGPWRVVFDGRYKLIEGYKHPGATEPSAPPPALFDLFDDPFEQTNIASKKIASKKPDVLRRLSLIPK